MKLPFHIIQLLRSKSGNDLRLPSDCEYLSLDIESKMGVRIGATTLKRLLGKESYYFINKLNTFTKKNYHLPSEAQWEYAAIGGKKSHGYKHAGSDDIKKVGWANVNEMKPVAQLSPNELGKYDMSGNCFEFCEDNMVAEPILNRTKNPIIRTTPKAF